MKFLLKVHELEQNKKFIVSPVMASSIMAHCKLHVFPFQTICVVLNHAVSVSFIHKLLNYGNSKREGNLYKNLVIVF